MTKKLTTPSWGEEFANMQRLHAEQESEFRLRRYVAEALPQQPEHSRDTMCISSPDGDFVVMEYFVDDMSSATLLMEKLALSFMVDGQYLSALQGRPWIDRHKTAEAKGPFALQVYVLTQLPYVSRPRLRVEIHIPTAAYGTLPVRLEVVVDPERQLVSIHHTQGEDTWGGIPGGVSELGTHRPYNPNPQLMKAIGAAGGMAVNAYGPEPGISCYDAHAYLLGKGGEASLQDALLESLRALRKVA